MSEIIEVFLDFNTDHIDVSNLGVQYHGNNIDWVYLDEDGVHLWGGNPIVDKNSEEYLPTKEERQQIFHEIYMLV